MDVPDWYRCVTPFAMNYEVGLEDDFGHARVLPH